MRALVIGGTLFIGRELVRRLLQAGHEVAVLHRQESHPFGPEVANLTGDRNDAESMRRALAGQRFDWIFDNVYDWQRGTTAGQVAGTARACGDGFARYVFMSSVAAYGDGLDRTEDQELAPDDHPESYVANKAASERALFRLHREEGLPVTTLRPPYVYGPWNPFYREAFFWDRLAAGRPIIVPGDGSRLMQFVYVKDLAEACLLAAAKPEAVGEGFNIAHERPVTQEALVRALAAAAGAEPELVYIPREKIEAAGGDVMGPHNMYFAAYYDMPPITQRIDKARALLGFEPSGFAAALAETYAWYLEHHRPPEPLDVAFEDELIRRAG